LFFNQIRFHFASYRSNQPVLALISCCISWGANALDSKQNALSPPYISAPSPTLMRESSSLKVTSSTQWTLW
jgi:hypothetical protein